MHIGRPYHDPAKFHQKHPCQRGGVETFRENTQIGHIGHVPWVTYEYEQAMEAMEKPTAFRIYDLLSHEMRVLSMFSFQTLRNLPGYW